MEGEVRYRFLVGFVSALAVPLAKIYQNGIDVENITKMAILGASLPVMAMAILVGLYAQFFEKECKDVKQLFKLCVALPGLIVAIGGGMVAESEAKAQTAEYECTPATDFQRGLQAVITALTGRKPVRYWLLERSPETDTYVVIKGRKYFVTAKLTENPGVGMIYDKVECKLINE